MYNNTMATIYRLPGDTDDFVTVGEEGDKVPDPVNPIGSDKPTVVGGLTPLLKASGKLRAFDEERLSRYEVNELHVIIEKLDLVIHHLSLITDSEIKSSEVE